MITYDNYDNFIRNISFRDIEDGVELTHDGYPLSARESKFISLFLMNGNLKKSARESGLNLEDLTGKTYIADEITYRLDMLKKQSIADTDEILQYFTRVMRNEEKDQFGLDAPLCERTSAAKELARRIVDGPLDSAASTQEIKVTLSWEGM